MDGMRHLAAALIVLFLGGCTREPEARTYQLQGQVLAVKPETREILIKHEDIPGFMPAMTMPYQVKDVAILEGKAAGDLVTATLMVAPDFAWLSAITKTGSAPLPEGASTRMPAAAGVHLLAPGDAVPETPLTDQDGEPMTLAGWRGSAIAVTFIYTRCPLPQYCPLVDRRFAEVQALVKADPALAGKVRLLSVSFDPQVDTPAMLRRHASKLDADPAMWRFATAPEAIVDRFAATFGVNVIREPDGTITHNLRTAVIDPLGRVVSIHDSNAWAATTLVDDLTTAIHAR
jgi:protein SCO1/2